MQAAVTFNQEDLKRAAMRFIEQNTQVRINKYKKKTKCLSFNKLKQFKKVSFF